MATWEHMDEETLSEDVKRFEWLVTKITDEGGLEWARRRLSELKKEQSKRVGGASRAS
jgi:hypothetical protein